jgi:hypothetical protein
MEGLQTAKNSADEAAFDLLFPVPIVEPLATVAGKKQSLQGIEIGVFEAVRTLLIPQQFVLAVFASEPPDIDEGVAKAIEDAGVSWIREVAPTVIILPVDHRPKRAVMLLKVALDRRFVSDDAPYSLAVFSRHGNARRDREL